MSKEDIKIEEEISESENDLNPDKPTPEELIDDAAERFAELFFNYCEWKARVRRELAMKKQGN